MTSHLPEIASRMLNTTLLLHPQKAEVLLWVLGPRIGISEQALPDVESQPDASRFVGSLSGGGAYSVERGAAIIPVMGTLVNRGAWTGAYSGMTSYEGLEASINRALADTEVSRIVLDINSPGGEPRAEDVLKRGNGQIWQVMSVWLDGARYEMQLKRVT